MKFTRNKELPSGFSQFNTKPYPIGFNGNANPSLDLNQATLVSATGSKIVFSAGDTTYELKGSFPTGSYTKMTDLMQIDGPFKTLALFQTIDGQVVLNMVLEVQSGESGLSVASLLEAFEDGSFYKFFAGNDVIHGTDFTNGDEEGGLGQTINGDVLRGWDGNDKIFAYAGDDELWGGGGKDTLDGGTGNDALMGGSGNDSLSGGFGNDSLYGGSGADKLVFDTALSSANKDTVYAFSRGSDKLVLDDDIFTRFAKKTTIEAKNLKIGTAAGDADDYLVFNPSNNTLYYDADGSGTGVAVEVAELLGVTTLSASDFQVIA